MSTTERPLRADARRNRAAVLAAAREIFAAHGPAAQIDDVAARAGVGVGTVYRHFPTKEALLTALVSERFREFHVHALAALEIADPFEALATMMRDGCRSIQDDSAFQLAMMGSADLDWEGIEADKADLRDTVGRLIDRAVAAGQVRADFTVDDYPMLMCGLTATMHFRPTAATWERHLELVLDGLRPPR